MKLDIKQFDKALVIQTAFFGDCILTSPLIEQLKELNTNLQIDVLSSAPTVCIFKDNPNITNIIKFDKRRSFFSKFKSMFSVIKQLRKNDYPIVISTHRSFTTSLIMVLSNIKIRVGFSTQKYVTHPVFRDRTVHTKDTYNKLCSVFMDEKVKIRNSSIYISDKDRESAKLMMRDAKIKIAVAPGSVWATKRWPVEYFKTLIEELTKRDIDIYLLGGPSENNLVKDILPELNPKVINLVGKNSFQESCVIIENVDLLISNDSGPLHVANGLDIPVVAIFGPTVKRFGFYPYREDDELVELPLECRPCGSHGGDVCKLLHHDCMRKILPEMVLERVDTILEKRQKLR